ncbi:MAG: hypothetical protein IKA79_00425 [Lentisphaeria bacterium]|nr:hypothetical protein [Lentisphaeria bacterium]
MKKIRNKTEQLLSKTEVLLTAFAMYFLHDREKAAIFAGECFLDLVEKMKNGEMEEEESVFLFREIRKKCFEFLCSRGKRFESSFRFTGEQLKEALAREGAEKEVLYEELCNLAEALLLLEEKEREIIFLTLKGSLSLEEVASVLDCSSAEVEETYLLALMKLGTKSVSGGFDGRDPGQMLRLTRSLTFLLGNCGETAELSPLQKEKILTLASAGVPFDYKRTLYKVAAILLFCLITAGIMVHSHMRVEPELQPEVKIGVFMPDEELKNNLFKEKEKQEKYSRSRETELTAIQISMQNFSGIVNLTSAAAEKRLKKAGVNVKIHKIETYGNKKGKIYLLVTPADALKISRSRKLVK